MGEGLSPTPEGIEEQEEKTRERTPEEILREMNTSTDNWQNPEHHS